MPTMSLLKKSQIYFGELFYGMFPTTIPLFIDCFIFSTKHIRPGICWKFLKVLFENGRCSFWVIPPGICWKISRQSLWRENLEGVKLFVWKRNFEDLTWNKVAKADSPKLGQKMWTQLWGRLGPGNIVFCPKWDWVVAFVLLDLEGVCLAPFRPVSQASDLASLQESLWLLRWGKFLDKLTCDFQLGGKHDCVAIVVALVIHAQVRHYQGLLSYLFFADVKYAFDLADWNLMLCACYWTPQATPLRTPKQKQNLVSVTMDNFEVSGRECQQLSPATRQRLEQQRQAMLDAWYWEERRRLEARLLEVAAPQKKRRRTRWARG